jgi:hypothetical protein
LALPKGKINMTTDWLIWSIKDLGVHNYYRWSIQLYNTSDSRCTRTSWTVPDLKDPRFGVHPDAVPGTAEVLEKARKETV